MKRNRFGSNKKTALLSVVLVALACFAALIVSFKRKITEPEDVKSMAQVKTYIPLQFPQGASVVNGKMRRGWSVTMAVKIRLRNQDLNSFLNQPVFQRNQAEDYSEITDKAIGLVQELGWDTERVRFSKAFNGISLTPETNRSDGLWMIVQNEKSVRSGAYLYLYYEG